MTYVLGIDLGTTYSAAATARDDRVEIVSLGDRSPTIPSIVLLREDGEVLVGEAAERRALQEPARSAREFKRRLGDSTPLILGGTPYGAEALSAHMLAAIVAKVVSLEDEAPAATVITHPANYGPYKRDLLREAARLADISSCTFLTEPEAAAIHYASRERLDPGDVVAVYDLGGGTFDSALLRKTDDGFVLVGTPEGMERLGGIDFDQAVFAHVATSLDGVLDELDADDPGDRAALARLRDECRSAKEALSTDTDVSIPILLPNVQTEVRLTRAELEAMVRPRLVETVGALERTVRSGGMSLDEVARILLVGGSSRIPLVGQLIREVTGRPVGVDAHPKFAIASGAAMAAAASIERGPIPIVPPPAIETVVERPAVSVPAPATAAPRVERRTPVRVLVAVGGALAAVGVLGVGALGGTNDPAATAGTAPTVLVTTSVTEATTTVAPTTTAAVEEPVATQCPRAAERFACITDLIAAGDDLLASFEANFDASLRTSGGGLPPDSNHLHFFFDTTAPADAGTQSPTPGVWRIWATPSPYGNPPRNGGDAGFTVADIPAGATQVCVLVADHTHAVEQGTGNCHALPAS